MADFVAPTAENLGTLLGVDDIDTARADFIIQQAIMLCQGIVDPLPATATPVVLSIAVRAYSNIESATNEMIGPTNLGFGAGMGGLYLTKVDKAALKRAAGVGGAFSVDPTPVDAGQNIPYWDSNTTWLYGIPLLSSIEGD